jgi:chaperonin GroEL (HSP60 family)
VNIVDNRENARKKDVRLTNIEAAKAVSDVIRTSLGPRGMDKMVRTRMHACMFVGGPVHEGSL